MKSVKRFMMKTCACALAGIITLSSLPVLSAEAAASGTLRDDFGGLPLGQVTESGNLKLIATGDSDKTQMVESEGILTISSAKQGHVGFTLKNDRFRQSELSMDFRFNAENNMTHGYEGLYVSPYCVEYDKTFAAVVIQPHSSAVYAQANQRNAGNVKFDFHADTWYRLKAKTSADKISFKIWDRNEPEPEAWTQEYGYTMSGDGTLAVYTYQNNPESVVSVSFDHIELTKNEGETAFQEDFNASAASTGSFFDKVDLIRDGNATDDKKAEVIAKNVLSLTSSTEGYSGIQYVSYDYKNNIAQLKIKFQEDFEAAGLTDGIYVSPVGTGLDEYAAIGVSPANGGSISVRTQKKGEEPKVTQGDTPVAIVPGDWYNLKVMTLEGQAGGENRICAKIWNEQEKEPLAWSIDDSYTDAISSGSFSVFSYNSGSHANAVFIDDIHSSYYTGGSLPSGNTKLSSISIGGTPLEGFNGDVFAYRYDVPQATVGQAAPEVTAAAADSAASVQITQAATLPGTAEIMVLAENGESAKYTVAFYLEGCKVQSIEEKAITIRKGISLEETPCPQTVKVTMASGTVVDTPVLWNMEEYDPENQEAQTVTGVLVPEPQYGMEVTAADIPTLKVIPREVQKEFFVSPDGSDSNEGTIDSPFLTVERAQREVRKFNGDMTGDIIVNLREGTYALTEPMRFDVSDSGSNGYYVVYQNYQDELPLISGAKELDAVWEEDPERPGVYKTTLDRERKLRYLYVNGEPAKITEHTVTGRGTVGTMTITGEESWAETSGTTWTGIKFNKSDVAVYANPEDVEITQSKVFNRNTVGIQTIYEDGDYIIFEPQQPFGAIFSTMAWGCNLVGTGSITIRNTLENLKNPGEFYFDRGEKTLYYYPPKGADINEMEFMIPESEGLIRMNGVSTSERVENIEFSGIQFSYDDYNLEVIDDPENGLHAIGYGGVQSLGLYRKFTDHGNWHHTWYTVVDTPYAAIEVQNAKGIIFEGNQFMNLSSSCAVSYTNDVVDSAIQGNAFINVAGNAANIGHPQHVFIGEDAKSDNQRFPIGVEGICKNNQVVHNLVRNVSSEFYQCDAIMAFFVENCDFSHNDVADVPYTCMCVGWGWWNFNGGADSEVPGNRTLTAKNNRILFNKLGDSHTKLPGDGGTLYTLGYQPDSIIAYNYIYDGPRSIYLDEGTEGYMVHDNVIQDSWDVWLNIWMSDGKIRGNTMYNNYTTTSSINNRWPQGNLVTDTHVESLPWSEPAQNIIDLAGLKGSYAELYELLNLDTAALEQAIKKANALSEKDYDRVSWNHLEWVLADAEKYLESGSWSQGAIDMMSRRLNKAMEELKDRQDNLFPHDASNLSITQDNGSLVLAWEAPQKAIDHYALIGLGETVKISADCNRYVIENPEPGKVYILTLCAVDSAGSCSEGATAFYSLNDFNAIPEESLLWLSAGDHVTVDEQGRVSNWLSQGDSGISAKQSKQNAQPVLVEDAYGGQPVIRFDGVDDTMSFDLDLDGKDAVTIIAVSAYQGTETGTGDQNCLVYFDEDGGWGKTFVSPLADTISWRYGSGQANNNNIYQRETSIVHDFSVTAVVKDSTEEALFVDGRKVMLQSGKKEVLANNVAEGRLCSYYFSYADHFTQYDLAELMIFDRALSDEEVGNIQAYLNLKYETDLDKIADTISLKNPNHKDAKLQLPELPKGIQLTIESSDPAGIIGTDGSISWAEQESKVNLVCRITNTVTKESVLTDRIALTLTPEERLAAITVTGPSKTEYELGEALDLTGLVVTAKYSDGSEQEITDYEVSGYDASVEGEQTITVSYEGKEATFTVTVKAAELDDGIDRSLLKDSIDLANIAKDNYPANLIEAVKVRFEAALAHATEVYGDRSGKYTQADVDMADDELVRMLQYLSFTADIDGLKAAIDHAKEIIASKQYENDAMMEAYKKALADAEALLAEGNITDTEIAPVVKALEEAEAKLNEAVTKLNLSSLQNEIGRSNNTKLLLHLYFDGAEKDAFVTELAAAKEKLAAAIANPDQFTQDEIDQQTLALHAARAALRLIPNKDALKSLIDSANAIDQSLYTAESVKDLKAALAAANAVYADEKADGTQIGNAEKTLEAAIKGLVLRVSDGGDSSKGDNANPGKDDNNGAQTGDTTNVLMLAVLLLSAAGAMLVLRRRKAN